MTTKYSLGNQAKLTLLNVHPVPNVHRSRAFHHLPQFLPLVGSLFRRIQNLPSFPSRCFDIIILREEKGHLSTSITGSMRKFSTIPCRQLLDLLDTLLLLQSFDQYPLVCLGHRPEEVQSSCVALHPLSLVSCTAVVMAPAS